MENFAITDYLETFNKVKHNGLCKACKKPVDWSRGRVAGHIRKCANATAAQMFKKYEDDVVIQGKVKGRWDYLATESSQIAYMLTPKYAAEGFYVDNDKMDKIIHAKNMIKARYPSRGLEHKVEQETARFMSKMSSLSGATRDSVFKLDASCYWNIIGYKDFPTLFLLAKSINEIKCSSAASERVWSIYRFIHTRLRNRLTNDKVEKLGFIYVNCAILDENDPTDYITEQDGISLAGIDCNDLEDE